MNITISAFFSGTGFKISDSNTVASQLYASIKTSKNQIAMGFDGCGVTYGLRGAIFGAGLDKQCQEVIKQIEIEIKKGNTVTLNAYGFSRGGIAALMLSKQLSNVDPNLLKINLAVLDSVPGNLITTSTLDPFDFSLAKKTMDLSHCKPLQKVLALYPHESLPAHMAHAPLFSLYPTLTQVEEDVIAGCHAQAEFMNSKGLLTFARVRKFFQENGTEFNELPEELISINDDKTLINLYEEANKNSPKNRSRSTHSTTNIQIQTKAQAEYFNLHHQSLSGVKPDKNRALATIEPKHTIMSKINQFTSRYPNAWLALQISFLSLFLMSLLFVIGILGAMPMLIGTPATLILLGVILAVPVTAIIIPAMWSIVSPVSQWILNRIFYPQFHMREIHPEKKPVMESSLKVLKNLKQETPDIHQEQIKRDTPADEINFNLFNSGSSLENESSKENFAKEFTI